MADADSGSPAEASAVTAPVSTPPGRGATPGGAPVSRVAAAASPEPLGSDSEEADLEDGDEGEAEPASPPADGSAEAFAEGGAAGKKKKKARTRQSVTHPLQRRARDPATRGAPRQPPGTSHNAARDRRGRGVAPWALRQLSRRGCATPLHCDLRPSASLTRRPRRLRAQKKRVKKPAAAAAAATSPDNGVVVAASSASPPAAPPDPGADSRFAGGLEQLRGGSLWCALAGAGVTDKRVKTLVDAMRSPGVAVTSLDLSGNRLSDAGAAALAAALGGGLAPDLIALNVAGNPLTETGRAALQSLARVRRGLDVTLVVPEVVTPLPSTPPPQGGRPRLPHTGKGQSSGMASRFFGAADDGEGGGGAGDARGAGGMRAGGMRLANAASALDAAHAALSAASAAVAGAAAGDADALHPAALSMALFAAVAAVDEELQNDAECSSGGIAAAQPSYPSLSSLPPATRTLAQGGEVLVAVLSLAPPPLPWQGGSGERACVGTHRLAALQLLARFVQLGCAELDALLAARALLPRAVALLFAHEGPSAVHAAVARLIQASLASACIQLWLPAFQAGRHGAPLQTRLAEAGAKAAPVIPGLRPTHIGAVIAIANGLRALQDGPAAGCAPLLRAALDADEAWCAFAVAELAQLNEQQAGTLCGPKPARPPPPFQAQQAGAGGGGAGGFGGLLGGSDLMPSGRGLLAMLQTFGRMSTSQG